MAVFRAPLARIAVHGNRVVTERSEVVAQLAEIFRERGFDGTSLSLITERTGLGKGSLYHFFPGGKEEMAAVVLTEIAGWFETRIYAPLRDGDDPDAAIAAMFDAVARYFRSGRRVCLVGAFALVEARDRFALEVSLYFTAWVEALAEALRRSGRKPPAARADAEAVISGIQGALVLSRALDDPAVFRRSLDRLREQIG